MTAASLYFAYGSNLHPLRLQQRAPSCSTVGVGVLEGHALRFHKRGADGSAKCNARRTDRRSDRVYGALYSLAPEDVLALDAIEGRGYERVQVPVKTPSGTLSVYTYLAKAEAVTSGLYPFSWYRQLAVAGARYHGLPAAYRARLTAAPAMPDPDTARASEYWTLLEALLPDRPLSAAAQVMLVQDG